MIDWRQNRIGSAERGENPTVLCRMRSGFAVIGDTQFLPGYCLLLAVPQVVHLTDMSMSQRRDFLLDMTLLGEAIECICGPHRINYEILGNTDPYVHAHVWPRYDWEPHEYIGGPVWRYPRELWLDNRNAFSEDRHGELKKHLTTVLLELMGLEYY